MEKPNFKFTKKGKVISITLVFLLILIYSSTVLYFKNHFYFGTTINCFNASGKTVEEVNKKITDDVKNYSLQLVGRDGAKEKITASDINIKCNIYNKIAKYKNTQSPYNIVHGIFSSGKYDVEKSVSYDDKLLKSRIDNLSFFNESKVINPQNASLKYSDKGYEIVNEVNGNKVNKDILYKKIVEAVLNNKSTINLEKDGCYENPKVTAKSKEIVDAKNTLNKYLGSEITYNIGENKVVLDSSMINSFIKVDDNFNVEIDNQKVKNYVYNLAYTYDTVGKTRDFVTALGQNIKVGGGNYGWAINTSKEADFIVQAIKEGKAIIKKPEYSRTARYYGIDDIGKTYIEIDLAKQHLWFYKDGNIVIDSDVVTGCVSANHATPEGVYQIFLKQRDAILKGADYASLVNFWMPFNQDIGIHDASWRTEFGKDIYLTNGSHGCVNSPYVLAETIFNNVEVGTPVICHN